MADKHEEILLGLELRMRQLMYLCDSLKEENQELKVQIREQQNELVRAKAEKQELSQKLSNLKAVNTLAGADVESVENTKKRLAKLVQDVDTCISLLKI